MGVAAFSFVARSNMSIEVFRRVGALLLALIRPATKLLGAISIQPSSASGVGVKKAAS